MRMGVEQYLVGGAVHVEYFEHLAVIAALLRPGEQLAVGECAGSALSETVVGVFVEPQITVEGGYVAFALGHLLASLHYYGVQASLYQTQGCE